MLKRSYKQLKILESPDMPFRSEKQRKYLFAKKPEIAKKWSKKYKKSINCANPKGFSQKAHCAGRRKK